MSERAAEAPTRTERRYEMYATNAGNVASDEAPYGPWVKFQDYDRLREQAEGLRAALEVAADALQASADAWEAEDYEGNAKVAATDARKARTELARYRGGDDGKE